MVRLCFCDTATVIFTVGAINDKPLAVDDTKTTEEDNPVVVDVQANDSDLDGRCPDYWNFG